MKWKKIILRTAAVLLVAIVSLVLVSVLAVKYSPRVRRRILARAEQYISDSTGTKVEIRDFKLALSNLSLQVEGIVARRPGSPTAPPLVQIESVFAEFKIDSVFRRQWHLQNLAIQHPVVHVSVDRGGQSDLPHATGGTSGIGPIFDLAVRKCLVEKGEIYFNDAKQQLEAEMQDVKFLAQLNGSLDRYQGVLRYDKGRVRYGAYEPLVHDLEANFALTRSQLTLDKLVVVSGQSRIALQGTLENFGSPVVQAVYDADLSGEDLRRVSKTVSVNGLIHASGSLNYQHRSDRPFLQSVALAGELRSPQLHVKVPAGRATVRDLNARYKLADGNVDVQDIRAGVLGGSLNAALTIRDLSGASHSRLQAHLRNVSLEQVEAAAPQYSLPEVQLRGKVTADADATWGATVANLVARVDATLEGAMGQAPSAPLRGAVHLDYNAGRREIELRQSYLQTPASSVTLDGRVSRYSQLQVAARSSNLHELEVLASSLRSAFSGQPSPKLDMYGAATFSGSITGLVTEPQVQGKLEARNLQVKGSAWKLVRANVEGSPTSINLSNGYLESATRGKINFSLRTGLDHWVYTPASPITAEISIIQIPVSDVERLANRTYPISGTLSGIASVHGSQLNPVGHGELRLTGGEVFSEPVENLTFGFQGTGETVRANLHARLSAGSAQAQLTLDPKTQQYQAQIQADNIRLERLQTVRQRKLPIVGALSLDAAGSGTLSSPELTGNITISELRIQQQAIQGLTATIGVHGQVAEVNLHSEVAQTPLQGHGTVNIKPPYVADLHLDTPRFSFQPLLALYAPSFDKQIHGEAELHASLRGPLQNKRLLEVHLEIPLLTAGYQQLEIGASTPLRVDYRDGIATLQPATLQGTGTNIHMQASIPVTEPANATYLVEGTVDLGLAQLVRPDLNGHGQIQVDLDSRRRGAGAQIGELRVTNASLHSSAVDIPIGLDNANGVLTVSPTRVEIKNFEGKVGGGAVTARGGVTFRPDVRFDVGISGSDVRLRYPEGVRSILRTDLTFTGNRQAAALAGTVIVERLSLTPDFDLGDFVNQLGEEESVVPSAGFTQQVRLDIQVGSAAQVEAVSTRLSFRGNASLHVVGTVAEPVILGRANLSGGDLFFGGNRYVVQNGAIDFVNPLRTEAVVNAQVKTKIDQFDITLNLQGPVDRLKTTYSSDPPLPPADIISLLAFGHPTESGNPVVPGNLGAQSALVQGLGSAVSSRVQKFAGLSYFSIDPTLGGSNQNAGARVVIQERVTSNLVVTYSTDVTSTQRQAIQLEYRLNPRWSISGVRDQNGGFGATASYHKSF